MNLYIKLFSFLSTSLLLVLLLTSPALAHDPLILLPEQKTPAEGPFLPDGTISFALYGSLLEEGDQRGFQFELEPEGFRYIIELGVGEYSLNQRRPKFSWKVSLY